MTGARTLEGLLSVLDGWREAALAEPAPEQATDAERERGQPGSARDRMRPPTQHPCLGPSWLHPHYGAIAQALLTDLDTEVARETTRILGHCDPGVIYDPGGQPRDRNTPKIEIRRISDLQTLGSHEL